MKKLDFKSAFNYPFNKAKKMWNILWILLPIVGWFVLGGYGIRIIKEFSKGKFKQLPALKFKKDLNLGFMMFLKSLPFILIYILISTLLIEISSWLEVVDIIFKIFAMPILFIHFFNKETIGSLFEFKILKAVFDDIGDYVIVLLKSILLGLIFLVMTIILIGLPAGAFTKNIFLADFYRRKVK
jgi:hypothetical protein